MRPTQPTPIELVAIGLLATNIETFLKMERTAYRNPCWFTGEEIAAKLGVPKKHGMIFLYAFSQLNFDRLEIEDGDTIRHRRD